MAFLFIAGVTALLLAQQPVLGYPLSLMMIRHRRLPGHGSDAVARPSLAICLCAYNEELSIVAKVESLLAMAAAYGPQATVYVYADAPTDQTVALLDDYRDRLHLHVSPVRRGKTAGMKLLVSMSQSELIAFTDANVMTEHDGLVRLAEPFGNPQIGCTSARLVYYNASQSPTATAGSFYWRAEEWLKRLESRTFGVIGVDGAFFMVRRALYEGPPDNLIDDLYVSLVILANGYDVITVEDVIARERSSTRWHDEFVRKRRIACQAMNVHRALLPRLRRMPFALRYAYFSHRYLKWLLPFTAPAALIFLLAAAGEVSTVHELYAAAMAGIILAVLGWLFQPRWPMIVVTSFASLAGVGMGVLQSTFMRKDYTTWEIAKSGREAL